MTISNKPAALALWMGIAMLAAAPFIIIVAEALSSLVPCTSDGGWGGCHAAQLRVSLLVGLIIIALLLITIVVFGVRAIMAWKRNRAIGGLGSAIAGMCCALLGVLIASFLAYGMLFMASVW
jgi:hypothetical protein